MKKTYSADRIREKHKLAFNKMEEKSDKHLTVMLCEKFCIEEMAAHFRAQKV